MRVSMSDDYPKLLVRQSFEFLFNHPERLERQRNINGFFLNSRSMQPLPTLIGVMLQVTKVKVIRGQHCFIRPRKSRTSNKVVIHVLS
ncbi:unnamed protein product [Allacma fusca]|uniref:Uncharacterized protein n=1 Tax=Allacma fusca TaxID=39272 RepID=A0A8J2KN13_9HEXA|nr:unnamed protein product [Allacma fusca]